MRNRTAALRSTVAAVVLCAMPLQNAFAATYALVVGADEYPFEVSLDGAVADAEDVAVALQQAGVTKMVKFINAEVKKDDIRRAWTTMLDEAVKDDTIIFTYAGHGAQMPELIAGDEEDGLDEFLQLPGLDRAHLEQTGGEMIVDNELNKWFKEADAKGVHVLFVSDSCHSGGMSRSVLGKSRLAPAITVQLQAPSEDAVEGAGIKDDSFNEVTVLAASLESQPTPEVIIDGKPRGALSWSFARSLEGAADRNGDGSITRIELEDYVFPTVKTRSEALQVPNFTPQVARSQDEIVVTLTRSVPILNTTVADTKPVEQQPEVKIETPVVEEQPVVLSQPAVKVWKSAQELGWTGVLTLQVAGSSKSFNNVGGSGTPYRWNATDGTFFTPNGDVAGENITEDMIQGVVDKYVVLDFLKALASQNPGQVTLKPVKDIYVAGDRLAFDAPPSTYKNMIVFNLANTGEVQLLDAQIAGTQTQEFQLHELEVVKPFGADHLVVISTNEPIDAIAAALAKPTVTPEALLKLLPQRLDKTDTAIAIQPLYTRGSL
ncbi:caspase family protein [Pararhizobium sp.]|uniref:caspase family protein n=1 Tax=Pararhizobium sp. TaxID=1977563 RepID=UPI00271E300B|nr:caspase family protein [Pararhizobium sp.]MDO9418598.1 caspase family protein [Pararhizobium sp.]